jgi:hypothetical protein
MHSWDEPLLLACGNALAVCVWAVPLYVVCNRRSLFRSVWQNGVAVSAVCAAAGALYAYAIANPGLIADCLPSFQASSIISFLMVFPIWLEVKLRDPLALILFGSWARVLNSAFYVAAATSLVCMVNVDVVIPIWIVGIVAWIAFGTLSLGARFIYGLAWLYERAGKFYRDCHRWPPNRRAG